MNEAPPASGGEMISRPSGHTLPPGGGSSDSSHTPPTQPPEKMLPLLFCRKGLQDKSQAQGVEGDRGITQSPCDAWEGAGNGRRRGERGSRKSPWCEGETPPQPSSPRMAQVSRLSGERGVASSHRQGYCRGVAWGGAQPQPPLCSLTPP